MMRVIITKRMLPMIVQGATAAEVAEIAQALAAGAGVAVGQCDGGAVNTGAAQAVRMASASRLRAVCYAPAFGLTPEGVAAVRRRRTRQARGGGRVTVDRLDGSTVHGSTVKAAQPEFELGVPTAEPLNREPVNPSPTRTTGHGGQTSHPPAPESLVQLMRLLVSRYTVDELAAKIPLDEAQVIRMYKGKRGTSPKTLRRLLDIASTSKPFLHVHTDLQNQLWADIKVRAHHLPKSWK